MFTIRHVAQQLNISEATLRTWQRRYGIVQPQRSSAGYRLYSDSDIAALAYMRQLLKEGHPAHDAAKQVTEAVQEQRVPALSPERLAAIRGDAAIPSGARAAETSAAAGLSHAVGVARAFGDVSGGLAYTATDDATRFAPAHSVGRVANPGAVSEVDLTVRGAPAISQIYPAVDAAPAPESASAAPQRRLNLADALTPQAIVQHMVSAAKDLSASQLQAGLDTAFAKFTFEAAIDDVVMPALRVVSASWAQGDLSLISERLFSRVLERRLGSLYEASGLELPQVHVLCHALPGARHEAGALAFAIAVRRLGRSATYPGVDVPISEWMRLAHVLQPAWMTTAIQRREDLAVLHQFCRTVWADMPNVRIGVGGVVQDDLPDGVFRLGTRVGDAAQLVTL